MRLLVVGAGASYAECKAAALPDELCLPLMKNLASTLWRATPFLEIFLAEKGHIGLTDPLKVFFELEKDEPTLIERFFASAWRHRDKFFTPYGRRWDDLMYHGLLAPLNLVLMSGLLRDNPHERMPLAEAVSGKLCDGDAVLNLNYDLIFDVALRNVGKQTTYSPHKNMDRNGIFVFKPHGSFHLAVDEQNCRAHFGQVRFIGDIQPSDGARTFLGFVPPRKNKSFVEHPVAKMIIEQLVAVRPSRVTFWGVGSPDSDIDLFDAYRTVCSSAVELEYVNPSEVDRVRFENQLGRKHTHYHNVMGWLGTARF